MAWDCSARDTLASSNIGPSSAEPGRAAQEAERTKLAKYQELEQDLIIIQVAQETIAPRGTEIFERYWSQN